MDISLKNDKSNSPSFSSLTLNQKETTKGLQLLLKYKSADISVRQKLTMDLFDLFDKKLQQESCKLSKDRHSKKDVLQDLYLGFLEGIVESLDAKNPLEYVINKINSFKPGKHANRTEYGRLSIDNPVPTMNGELSKTTFASVVTKDFSSKRESSKNLSKQIKHFYEDKDEIDTILTNKEQQICNLFLGGLGFKDIAKIVKVTEIRVREHFGVIISKIKDYYNAYDQATIGSMQIVQNNLKVKGFESVKKLYVKAPKLQKLSAEEATKKIQDLSDLLEIMPEKSVKLLSKYPNLLTVKPSTIQDRITKSSELLNLDEKTFKKMGTTVGSLLYAKPESLKQKVDEIAKTLQVPEKSIIDLSTGCPGVLTSKSSTIAKNIDKVAEMLNISKEECIRLYNKFPYLISRNIKSLKSNMAQTCKILHLDKETFNKIAIKQPNLIYQSPKTIFENVKTLSESLSVPQDRLVQSYVKRPQLFIQKPETLKNNVQNLSKLLGISIDEAVNLCLSSPQLFCNNPQTALAHAQKYAELTKQPLQQVIKKGLKQYSIFLHDSNNLVKKKNILSFFSKIRNKEETDSIRLNSTNELYASILRYLIKSSGVNDFPSSRKVYEITKEYILSHPDKHYSFELPQHSEYNEFVKFSQNLSNELLGKNIFDFKVKE